MNPTTIDKIMLIKNCNDIYDVYDYRNIGIDETIKIINPAKFAEKLGINIIFDKKQSISKVKYQGKHYDANSC